MKASVAKAAVLLVPTLVLGGLSLLHTYNQRNGVLWQVPITGYDPRDLLSGHYLQFRYAWNQVEPLDINECLGEQCALCADNPAEPNPAVTVQPLALARERCPAFIAGTLDEGGSFLIGGDELALTRYYIPEDEALRLDTLLRNQDTRSPQFFMGLRVNSTGQAFIDTLYVDGMPLEEWLRTP